MNTPFPSLGISQSEFRPQGSFAESQAAFLKPNPELVEKLDGLLAAKKMGVVSHFYMDPELQGALSACSWPHVHISDSLAMADAAVRMVEAGCESIVVLGVDFMSENARAMLDAAGHVNVPVYRVAADPIGCSLAESAEAKEYGAYLHEAKQAGKSLHVVYINTSLRTKAKAHALVPTITCTSSNVVKTVLMAFEQIDDVSVFFGPDTYMGQNLVSLFRSLQGLPKEKLEELHRGLTHAQVERILGGLRYFQQGTCIVHHMFGEQVATRTRDEYADAYVTAHLEVPGEMFELALEKQQQGKGVVGSTSNILGFILDKVREQLERSEPRSRFVLGTEASMITPVVNEVQKLLREAGSDAVVEIIFPVAAEAIAQTDDNVLKVVPGVAAGEGCTTAGGCATCPYMKMNNLSALIRLAEQVGAENDLSAFYPRKYDELIEGRTMTEVASESILHMRAFSQTGRLPDALVKDVLSR